MVKVKDNSTDPSGAHPDLLSTCSATWGGVLPEGSAALLYLEGQAESAMS